MTESVEIPIRIKTHASWTANSSRLNQGYNDRSLTIPWIFNSTHKNSMKLFFRICLFLSQSLNLGCYADTSITTEPLEPETAFQMKALVDSDNQTILVEYRIAPGTYLYRDKLKFTSQPPGLIRPPKLPAGEVVDDDILGKTAVYRRSISLKLPIETKHPAMPNHRTFILIAESQGCAEIGICYPPLQQKVEITIPSLGLATKVQDTPVLPRN